MVNSVKKDKKQDEEEKKQTEFIHYMHVMQYGYNALMKLVQSIFHPFFAPLCAWEFHFHLHHAMVRVLYVPLSVFGVGVGVVVVAVVVFCFLCVMQFARIRITESGHTNINSHFQCADLFLDFMFDLRKRVDNF